MVLQLLLTPTASIPALLNFLKENILKCLILFIILIGCAQDYDAGEDNYSQELIGKWNVLSVDGKTPIESIVTYSMIFHKDGRLDVIHHSESNGTFHDNSFTGTYTICLK